MIIALVTFISILLVGGNTTEVFYVDQLDKLVSKHVVDKSRKKETLTLLNDAKKDHKIFLKQRKSAFSEFSNKVQDVHVSSTEITKLCKRLMTDLYDHNGLLIDYRIKAYAFITAGEWEAIIQSSKEQTQKRLDKQKLDSQNAFKKTRKSIYSISEVTAQKIVNDQLNVLITKITAANDVEAKINSVENEVLSNKNSSKEELTLIQDELSKVRLDVFNDLIEFRTAVIKNSTQPEAEMILGKLMSELNF